jgi:hypothetical protein
MSIAGETTMKIITIVTALLLTMTCPGFAGAKNDNKASASYKQGICDEISKYVDALVYGNTNWHGSTMSCSFTDKRLVIKSKIALPREQMKHFVLFAFTAVGAVNNNDFMLPDKIYVGYGEDCQVLTTEDASRLQDMASFGVRSGLSNAMTLAANAPKVPCPE